MRKLLNQRGVIHTLPLLVIIAAVGVISFLLISSTLPLNGLFGNLNPKPESHAATTIGSTWANVTGNLAGMASTCGNLYLLSNVPGSNTVIAGVTQKGLWANTSGTTWSALGTGAGSATITNGPSWIVYDPTNPAIFWEAGIYFGGGVYKTTDGGQTFQQLGNSFHNDYVSVDFTDPNRQTLLAGGHEQSQKLYKSTNGGSTWTDIGASLPAGSGASTVPYIINSQTYIVETGWGGGAGGIYRTTNGGTSWTQVSTLGPSYQPLVTVSGTIYWAAGSSLAKSTDNGATWTQVGSGLQPRRPIEMPDSSLVAIGANNTLVRSTDGGSNWSPFGPSLPFLPSSVIYSESQKALFINNWDCGNVVPANAIMKLDYDLGPASSPIPVIFDTDMSTDVDDAGALAMLHAFADNGEVKILGITISSSSGAQSPQIGFADAVDTYYNRPNIPIGIWKGGAIFNNDAAYTGPIANNSTTFPHDLTNSDSAVPEAYLLMRQILASQPDHSVTMIATGPMNNLRKVIESPADQYSSLLGRDLVALKVKQLVQMGGQYPSNTTGPAGSRGPEWNFYAGQQLGGHTKPAIDNWPTPLVFAGFEVGDDVITGNPLQNTAANNPVRQAYNLYTGGTFRRASYDHTAVLYAIRGLENNWSLVSTGYNRIAPNTADPNCNGCNAWQNSPDTDQSYLVRTSSAAALGSEIDALMSKAPGAPISSPNPSTTPGPTGGPSSPPTPVPTPPPGALAAPIVTIPSCITPGYTASGVTITWGTITPAVSVVDLGSDPNFVNFTHKFVSGGTATTAPAGFTDTTGALSLNPNTQYFTRYYNGVRSTAATFTIPACGTASPSPSGSGKVGDLDNDGDVDIFDYSTLVSNFGRTGTNILGDVDHDGDVDIFDYSALVSNFGK